MLLLLSIHILQVAAHELNVALFEKESEISLKCKKADRWADVSAVSCSIAAAAEAIYNFGFVIQEEGCMVCRAGGMPGDVNVPEISITGSVYVDCKGSKSGCYNYVYINHINV